jgi:hypothetical protein
MLCPFLNTQTLEKVHKPGNPNDVFQYCTSKATLKLKLKMLTQEHTTQMEFFVTLAHVKTQCVTVYCVNLKHTGKYMHHLL